MNKGIDCLPMGKRQAGHKDYWESVCKVMEEKFLENSLIYEHFPLDSAVSNFPEFEEFHNLWSQKKQDRFLPAWKDFDFEDFQPWWGSMCVVDFTFDPFDYCYRLWGTKVVEVYQVDYSQKWQSSLVEHGLAPETDIIYYKPIANEAMIGWYQISLEWLDREFITVKFLDLPLSRDGKTVNHSMSIMI